MPTPPTQRLTLQPSNLAWWAAEVGVAVLAGAIGYALVEAGTPNAGAVVAGLAVGAMVVVAWKVEAVIALCLVFVGVAAGTAVAAADKAAGEVPEWLLFVQLPGWFFGMVFVFLLVGATRSKQDRDLRAVLAERGVPCTATVVSIESRGQVNNQPVLRTRLHMTPVHGGDPFEVTDSRVWELHDLPSVGRTFDAVVDPTNVNRYVLDDNADAGVAPAHRTPTS